MSDLIKAAEDARRLLRGFQAFAEVADALDKAAVAEQRKKEAEGALPALHAERDKLTAAVKQAKAKIDTLTQEANNVQAQAVAAAAAIKNEAVAAAEKAVAEASENARTIVMEAEQRVTDAEQRLVDTERRNAELQAAHDDLQSRITTLREQAAALLGGTV
jgi:chromosome segregation ATPase